MAKLLVAVLCAAIAGVLAEPPSSYLPPQARNAPSAQYGAPFGGFNDGSRGSSTSFHSQRTGSQSFSYNSQHESGQTGVSSFRGAGHGTFGSSRKSSFGGRSFSSASRQGFGTSASAYSAPSQTFSALTPTYSVPAPTYSAPSSTYGAPSKGFGRQQSFGSTAGHGSFGSSSGFGSSSTFSSSSQGFSAGQSFSTPAQRYSTPSPQYSVPSAQYSTPSSQYGPPSTRYGAPFGKKMDDDLAEPANYEYRYQVLAGDESGAEFGHQESRENEAAKGQYHVLLPDGRMQIVEYEADEEGFRPNIRYEETGAYPAARNNDYNGLEGPY